MVRIVQIQRERPNLKPPIPASPNKSYGASIRGNRKYLKRSSLAEQLLRLAGTIAADPPDAEFIVARGNIRPVNNVLSVRGPDRMPVQSGTTGQPGYRAALEIVNGEVSRDRQRQPVAVRRKARSLRLLRYADGWAYDPLWLSGAIQPGNGGDSGSSRPARVQQNPGPGKRDPARRGAFRIGDIFKQGRRCAVCLQTPEVERYAIKRSLTEIYEVAARQITPKVTAAPNHLDPSRLERKNFDVGDIESGAGSCDEAGEHNVFTAGQNLRPTPGPLAVLLRLADDLRFTPARRHAEQMVVIQIGNDRAVLSPGGAAPQAGSIAQRNDPATLQGDLLQLLAGEESDPLAIRRKEGIDRSFRACEHCDCGLVEAAHCQLLTPIRRLRGED